MQPIQSAEQPALQDACDHYLTCSHEPTAFKELAMKFVYLINDTRKDTMPEFRIKGMTPQLLKTILELWEKRVPAQWDRRLKLYLKDSPIANDYLVNLFHKLPSIYLFIDDQEIHNDGFIMHKSDVYYEGRKNQMKIIDVTKKCRYQGQVDDLVNLRPHGYGQLFEFIGTRDQTIYEGYFKEGLKEGVGREIKRNVRYEGQWVANEKQGLGIEYIMKKRKKNDPSNIDTASNSANLEQRKDLEGSQFSTLIKSEQLKQEGEQASKTTQTYKDAELSEIKRQQLVQQVKQQQTKAKKQENEEQIKQMQSDNQQNIKQQDEESKPNDESTSNKITTKEEINKLLQVFRSVYDGGWKKGVKSGEKCKQYTKNGVYEGDFKQGAKNGHGKMVYSNGAIYEGQWKNNFLDGKGTYTDEAGNVYEGEFQLGAFDGQGTMNYKNGDCYTGMWSQGKKHGKGVYTFQDGDYFDGDWVKDSAEGVGQSMTNGIYYDGPFLKGRKHGLGQYTDENGDDIQAIFKHGQEMKKISKNGEPFESQA